MATTQDRWINKVLGGTRYVISEKLGEGGMGSVYLAEDRQLGTWVVIKTPHSSMVRDPEFAARFKLEVQSLIALSHPRIVRVLDVGQYGEFPFVVLQYLSGSSLESRLYPSTEPTARPQLLTQVCAWLTEIASALDFIHLQGYIHRDIKPANILFDENQHAYLTDFGIAKVLATVEGSSESKLTATGMILGTAEYMAPELLQGKPVDRRVDQYALAVTVFEALSGTRPYDGNTPAALAFAQVQQPIPQVHQRVPGLPEEVSNVLSRALALSPQDRFRSCDEFAAALRRSGQSERSKSVTSRKRAASETLATSVASTNLPDTDRGRKRPKSKPAPEVSSINHSRLLATGGIIARWRATTPHSRGWIISGVSLVLCMLLASVVVSHFYRASAPSNQSVTTAPSTPPDIPTPKPIPSPKPILPPIKDQPKRSIVFGKSQVGIPTAERGGAMWQYMTSNPGSRWHEEGFDAKGWKTGRSGFGVNSGGVAFGLTLNTPWSAKEIWLRTRVTLPASINNAIVTWRFYHDDDIKIFVNGQLLWKESGYTTKYMTHVAEQPLLREGENVIAVYCHNENIPSGVDVGFDWKEVISSDNTPAVPGASAAVRPKADLSLMSPPAIAPKSLESFTLKEPLTLTGHTDAVFSVAFNVEGTRLASASRDKTVKVWDAASGQEKLTLNGHTSSVMGVTFSADANQILSASQMDGTVKVWDATSGQQTLTLKGPTDAYVLSVAFSPDGKWLASATGSTDGIVKIWGATSGQKTLTLKGHTNTVNCVTISPDGKRLASASFDQTAKVWDAASGQETLTFKGHAGIVLTVAFSPDGKRLASASDDNDNTVKVWDAVSGQERLTLKGHSNAINCVAFSPDGKWLASASRDKTIKLWDTTSGVEVLTLQGHTTWVTCVAFSADGKRLASASGNSANRIEPGEVKVWDLTTRNEADSASLARTTPVEQAAAKVELFNNSIGMTLKLIPAGEFLMGSPNTEVGRQDNEGPQHRVKITQPFYMGVHEVTQGQYEKVMGTNPSYFSKSGGDSKVSGQDTSRFPVESVSWNNAIEFCNNLSELENRTPCYGSVKSASVELLNGDGYRLPTEAEWEYACRAGTETPFHFGTTNNGREANVSGQSPYGTKTKGPSLGRTTTVGAYRPNAFGLFDMHGNVWEWCEDVYDAKAYAGRSGTITDPKVTSGSGYRVLRGGSWFSYPWSARSAVRLRYSPGDRDLNFGFRVVCISVAVRTK